MAGRHTRGGRHQGATLWGEALGAHLLCAGPRANPTDPPNLPPRPLHAIKIRGNRGRDPPGVVAGREAPGKSNIYQGSKLPGFFRATGMGAGAMVTGAESTTWQQLNYRGAEKKTLSVSTLFLSTYSHL